MIECKQKNEDVKWVIVKKLNINEYAYANTMSNKAVTQQVIILILTYCASTSCGCRRRDKEMWNETSSMFDRIFNKKLSSVK